MPKRLAVRVRSVSETDSFDIGQGRAGGSPALTTTTVSFWLWTKGPVAQGEARVQGLQEETLALSRYVDIYNLTAQRSAGQRSELGRFNPQSIEG